VRGIPFGAGGRVSFQNMAQARIGIHAHRAELETGEMPPARTDTTMPEQHRAAVGESHQSGNQQHQRQEQSQGAERHHHVHDPDPALRPCGV
jgi:hypothetical protein